MAKFNDKKILAREKGLILHKEVPQNYQVVFSRDFAGHMY